MTVQAPRKRKPTQLDEVLRTLAIYDLLLDGIGQRHPPALVAIEDPEKAPPREPAPLIVAPSGPPTFIPGPIGDILIVAERIAARTES